jgi:hypothetical protein
LIFLSLEGEKIMPSINGWNYPGASAARARCRVAVERCSGALPKPQSYITHIGQQFRQLRLCVELAEFDLLYRQAEQGAASLDQLECVCMILIESSGGRTPTTVLPLDEQLLVNRSTFPVIQKWMEARLPKIRKSKMAKTNRELAMERKAMMHEKIAEQGQKQPLAIPNRNNRSMKVSVGWDPNFDWNVEFEEPESANFSPGGDGSQVPYIQSKLISILRDAESQSLDGFVIIGRSGQHFMQCLYRDIGWILEKRVGGESEHWRAAVRPTVEPSVKSDSAVERILRPAMPQMLLTLTFDQVAEAMGAYLASAPDPAWLQWERIEV